MPKDQLVPKSEYSRSVLALRSKLVDRRLVCTRGPGSYYSCSRISFGLHSCSRMSSLPAERDAALDHSIPIESPRRTRARKYTHAQGLARRLVTSGSHVMDSTAPLSAGFW